MPQFNYVAVDDSGRRVRGRAVAESEHALVRTLNVPMGLHAVTVVVAGSSEVVAEDAIHSFGANKTKLAELWF
jgi:type II secretory pathway component PulF